MLLFVCCRRRWSSWWVLTAVVLVGSSSSTFGFSLNNSAGRQRSTTTLQATSGRGMGMGMGTKKNNKKKKNGRGGGTTKKSSSPPFDANASLLRLEKKYEDIMQASNKALHIDDSDSTGNLASEMVVTVRAMPSKSAGTSDWVPVAQLCLHPHAEVHSEWAQAAISLYCRELAMAAALGSKLFATVPRQDLQYAIEPVESFYKYVYDTIVEQPSSSSSSGINGDGGSIMTKAEARAVLELPSDNDGEDQAAIKQAYRQKSFQWHPDRLSPEDDKDVAKEEYAKIQQAYATLTSGIRSSSSSSWYASLGGRDRTCFRPLQELMNSKDAKTLLDRYRVKSAVVGLDQEVVQIFVARNQAAGNILNNGYNSNNSNNKTK